MRTESRGADREADSRGGVPAARLGDGTSETAAPAEAADRETKVGRVPGWRAPGSSREPSVGREAHAGGREAHGGEPTGEAAVHDAEEFSSLATLLAPRERQHRRSTARGNVSWLSAAGAPGEQEPAPRMRRMLGVMAWSAVLTIIGIGVGARVFFAMLFLPQVPRWFHPAVIGVGIIGVLCTGAAFTVVQHRRLPWLLLPAATVAVCLALVLTLVVL